jgi:hypothetical protein
MVFCNNCDRYMQLHCPMQVRQDWVPSSYDRRREEKLRSAAERQHDRCSAARIGRRPAHFDSCRLDVCFGGSHELQAGGSNGEFNSLLEQEGATHLCSFGFMGH